MKPTSIPKHVEFVMLPPTPPTSEDEPGLLPRLSQERVERLLNSEPMLATPPRAVGIVLPPTPADTTDPTGEATEATVMPRNTDAIYALQQAFNHLAVADRNALEKRLGDVSLSGIAELTSSSQNTTELLRKILSLLSNHS